MKNINEIAEKIIALNEEYGRLEWTQYTTGYDFGMENAYNKIINELSSEENFEAVKKEYESTLLDAKDKRKAEIVYKMFEPFHLSREVNELSIEIQNLTNKLSKILNTHRSTINGREVSSVDIAQILSTEPDREKRKEAFFARCQVNKPLVEGGFIELIKLRKEYAKKRGFNNFVEMRLSDDDLNYGIFSSWIDDIHKMLPKMQESRENVAKKFLNDTTIEPWDEAYISSKIAPSLSKKVDMSCFHDVLEKFFLKFGIDISKFNITYDIFPRANKSEWGYNFPISTGKDSRILANVKNEYKDYNVLLHETGHGIHSFLLNPDETILNEGISGIIEEGIANLFGNFIYEDIFYKDFFGNDENVDEEFSMLKEYLKYNSMRMVVSILFDQRLYLNNIESMQDIDSLYLETHKEVLDENLPTDVYPWGYRIHHTTHPIYLHNYFMGDVTCEMLKKVFCKNNGCSKVSDKPLEFTEFLISSVISPSGLYKFPELFKRISGEDFSLKFM